MKESMRYLQMAIVSALFFLGGYFVAIDHNTIVGVGIGLIGLVHWKFWPEYVEQVVCTTMYANLETQTDPCGLVLKPSSNRYVTFEQIVQIYKDTMECVGMGTDIPGPTVEYTSFARLNIGEVWGVYSAVSDLVLINTDETVTLDRNCTTDTEVLRHEFIHHILNKRGFSDESSRHEHTAFQCGLGVNTHN